MNYFTHYQESFEKRKDTFWALLGLYYKFAGSHCGQFGNPVGHNMSCPKTGSVDLSSDATESRIIAMAIERKIMRSIVKLMLNC